MNAWQIAMEIRDRLRTLQWPGGFEEVVFGAGSVFITAGAPTEDMIPGSWPFAYIFVGASTADGDEPGLETRPFTIAIAQVVEGDKLGESAVAGGARQGGNVGTSRGRGVLEIAEVVATDLKKLTGWLGVPITWAHSGSPAVAIMGQGAHLATQSLNFSALCTVELEVSAPFNVQKSGVTMTWEESKARHGFVHYRVVRKDGAEPPQNVEDGETVYTGRDRTTSSATGTGSFGVFAGYSLVEGDAAQVYSETDVGTWR